PSGRWCACRWAAAGTAAGSGCPARPRRTGSPNWPATAPPVTCAASAPRSPASAFHSRTASACHTGRGTRQPHGATHHSPPWGWLLTRLALQVRDERGPCSRAEREHRALPVLLGVADGHRRASAASLQAVAAV